MSRDRGKSDNNAKLFITNLSPIIEEEKLKDQLERMFETFGRIQHLNAKKNKNGQYSFAFLEFERAEDAMKAIEEMDQKQINGRPMKVRQDRQMEGCFNCKKDGHFAKQCPEKQRDRQRQYRKRSPEHRRPYNDDYHRSSRRKSPDRYEDRYRRQRSNSYSDEYRRRQYKRSKNYHRSRSPREKISNQHSRQRSRERSSRERAYRRRDYERDHNRNHKYRRQRYSRSPRSYSYDSRSR